MRATQFRGWFASVVLFLALSLAAQAQTWSFTGSMDQARHYFTATLLNNGQVLIVGGTRHGVGGLAEAELYNPATGTFSTTGSLNTGRYSHTATLLNNGRVLLAGGGSETYPGPPHPSVLTTATAELYTPSVLVPVWSKNQAARE